MPPRILALRLTLVQSNSAILIGSLDSTACAVMGVRAVAARAARPNKALVTRNLFMDVFLPGSQMRTCFLWSGPLPASVVAQALGCQCQTENFVVFCGFERIFLLRMTIS